MDPLRILLGLVLLPGAICAVAAVLGWVVGRRSARGREAVRSLGIGAAFVASMFALEMGPEFPLRPSEDGWLWVVWIGAGGALLAVVEALVRAPLFVRTPVRFAAVFGGVWLLARPLMPHALAHDAFVRYAATASACATLLWSVLADARPRVSRVSLVVPVLVALPGAAAILAAYGHSLRLGMAVGALGVAVGATAILGWRRKDAPLLPPAAAAVIAPVFVGVLAAAPLYLNFGTIVAFPPIVALLLVLSAACGVFRSWKVALILAVLLVGGAAVVAGVNDAKNVPSAGGW